MQTCHLINKLKYSKLLHQMHEKLFSVRISQKVQLRLIKLLLSLILDLSRKIISIHEQELNHYSFHLFRKLQLNNVPGEQDEQEKGLVFDYIPNGHICRNYKILLPLKYNERIF